MNTRTKSHKISSPLKNLRISLIKTIVIPLKKNIFNEKYKTVIFVVILGALAADIFSTTANSDVVFYGITILYFISTLFYQLKSRLTFIICLVLLVLMYFNFLVSGATGPSPTTEKIAVWLFLFLVVGIIQQWKE